MSDSGSYTDATVLFWEEQVKVLKLTPDQLQQFKQRITDLVNVGLNGFSGLCKLEWTNNPDGAIDCILMQIGIDQNPMRNRHVVSHTTANEVAISVGRKSWEMIWQR